MSISGVGPLFDGETFDPYRDGARLQNALGRVALVMKDGKWRTLEQIAEAVKDTGFEISEAGISARLRDFRKAKFGSHVVERERVSGGLWRYRVVL